MSMSPLLDFSCIPHVDAWPLKCTETFFRSPLLEEKQLLSAGKGTVLAVTFILHHPLGEDYRGL